MTRVDHAEVVQARDVDAVADELGEVLDRLGLSGGDRERVRQRPPVARLDRSRVACGHGAVLCARGGRAVPDDASRDAVLDEHDRLLRRALEVERLRQAARIERVVADRDLLVGDPPTELLGQVAAPLQQPERAERVVREVVEEVGERVRLQHRAVRVGRERARPLRPRRFLRGLAGHRGRVDVSGAPRRLLRVAGAAVGRRDHERRRVCHALLHGQARRRRNRKLGQCRREEAVDRYVPGRVDRCGGEARLVVRTERRRRLVVAFDLRRLLGRREPREALVFRRALRRSRRTRDEIRKALAVDLVRRRDACAVSVHDPERDDEVLDQRRLVHLGPGKTRKPGAFRMRDRLGIAARSLERGTCGVERAHDFTPTCT